MLKYIIKMLKSLNANAHPGEIAHALSCGVILGFLPKDTILWYVFFILFLFLRINKGAFLLTTLIASMFAPLFDNLFDTIGYAVLTYAPFEPTFRALLDIPFVAFTRFNNSIVAGAIVAGLALYIPLYIFARVFVSVWRKTLQPKLARSKFVVAFTKIPLVRTIIKAAEKLEAK